MTRLHYLQMSGLAPGEWWTGHHARHEVTATACPDFKSWCFPSRIAQRARPFESIIGPADYVVDRHTLYPLYSRMLPPEDAAKVRSHLLGEPVHGLPAMIGAGGPHSGWATFQPAYCDHCVRRDIAPTGVPYWRTEHQIPGGSSAQRMQSRSLPRVGCALRAIGLLSFRFRVTAVRAL